MISYVMSLFVKRIRSTAVVVVAEEHLAPMISDIA